MKLVVGLGNPGPQYATTRHNAGFLMVDLLADHFACPWGGQKFDGELAKGAMFGEPVLFFKPLTYMNLSGRAVAKALGFYKLAAADMIVVHDDIDLASGTVKARTGGGHGGHNGIRSIIAETGESEFHRLKLGIGRPEKEELHRQAQVSQWVLAPFSDAELKVLANEMLAATLLRLKNVVQG